MIERIVEGEPVRLPPGTKWVVATWNGIPADNSGKREVRYLTDRLNPMGTANIWTIWRSQAQLFDSDAEAVAAIKALKLEHLRTTAKAFPNDQVHVMTGGIAGKELT